eukprot:8737635-Pyramimonas_sp.AAC.1
MTRRGCGRGGEEGSEQSRKNLEQGRGEGVMDEEECRIRRAMPFLATAKPEREQVPNRRSTERPDNHRPSWARSGPYVGVYSARP